MALADILERIAQDASAEAAAVEAAASERATSIIEAARAKAQAHTEQVVSAAERDAARDAETVVVNARLRGRDELVAAQRELIDETLRAAAEQVAQLPDDAYARFLARRIVQVARGGETLSFGSMDASRAELVLSEVRAFAPALELTRSEEPAPFERGALLRGPRVRADLSLEALVSDRRDELELVAARALFGEGE